MKDFRRPDYAFISVGILVCAAIVRLPLALLNNQANDNHFRVVQLLMNQWRPLTMSDCRECFQPKLFYFLMICFNKIMPIKSVVLQIRLGQCFNLILGILIILILKKFLEDFQYPVKVRLWILALFAFNPMLVSMSVQYTNDNLVIFLSSAAIFLFYRFLSSYNLRDFALGGTLLALGFASKGTAWVCGLATIIILFVKYFIFHRGKSKEIIVIRLGVLLLGALLITVIFSAGYDFKNYQRYAFLGKNAPFYFFQPVFVGRPGIISMWESYFSFKIWNLIQFPYTSNQQPIDPYHRVSLWTQLYGRFHSIRVESWPPSWGTRQIHHFWITRLNLVFGILPSFFFVAESSKRVVSILRAIKVRTLDINVSLNIFYSLLLSLGSIAFIIVFTFQYRDFASMKPIYIAPCLLGFVKIYGDAFVHVFKVLEKRWLGLKLIQGFLVLLILGYIVEASMLSLQLFHRNWTELASTIWGV